ncbi:hypothetical protein KIN20_009803 [Parelaphostrongylus tenuis]|uniref:1-acylglycerol-3-phosphate O-acyltransferase n=1 Tax=Parelaphostrongylus tenuis TaxID=148309 RepID=A0AAD5M8N4_PARTN|nr:hypothetical protein KIN20_009803 [Parelaphostrongylus tenuis]
MFLYLTSLIISGAIGGILSLPYGRTTENHRRVFGTFQLLCSFFLRLRYTFRNRHYIDGDRPFIIIANHQSALDVLGMTYCWPKNCVVMLKSSLKFLPGFNLAAYLCNAVFINRFSKEKAHKALDSTLEAITKYQRKVWIYPEGTRNPGNVMLPFKKGAFVLSMEAKVPIVCCIFSSHSFFYDAAERRLNDGECLVEFLPPVDPSKFNDVLELSDHCWKIMMAKFEDLNKELSNKLSHKSN